MSPVLTCSGCTTPIARLLSGFGLAPVASYCPHCTARLAARWTLAAEA